MNRSQTKNKQAHRKKSSRKKKMHADSEIFTDRVGSKNGSARKASPVYSADKGISQRIGKIKEGFQHLENQLSSHPNNDMIPITQQKKKNPTQTFTTPRTAKKYPNSRSQRKKYPLSSQFHHCFYEKSVHELIKIITVQKEEIQRLNKKLFNRKKY